LKLQPLKFYPAYLSSLSLLVFLLGFPIVAHLLALALSPELLVGFPFPILVRLSRSRLRLWFHLGLSHTDGRSSYFGPPVIVRRIERL